MISKTVVRWLTLVALVGLSLGVMVPAASAAFVGTEITACSNTPILVAGNFFLKKNLTATGTDCIRVEHSNVAIDMNGHTITGDGAHRGITDNGVFVDSVAIANGKIKDFDEGIDFFGCCSSELITIEKVDVSNNKGTGIVIEGCCNSITDVKANGDGDDGIFIDDAFNVFNKIQANDNTGDGLFAFCCNTANQITANGNTANGINLEEGSTGVSNSQANDNKENGIFMTSSSNSLANIKASGNTFAGTDLTGDDNQATNVTADNNGADGMEFGSDTEDVADSVANNNKVVGIDLGNGTFNTATDLTANHNGTDGVALKCPGNAVNVRAHNNTTNLFEITPALCTILDNNAP